MSEINAFQQPDQPSIDERVEAAIQNLLADGAKFEAGQWDQEAQTWLMDARQGLLDKFADDPDNDAIWETAYAWVAVEHDAPARWIHDSKQIRPAIADDIPGAEIIELAKRVRAASSGDRYGLMAERASNGQYWFDVLKTFSSDQLKDVEATIVKSWAEEAGTFRHALDLGTGTGKTLGVSEPYAEAVTGLDRNRHLLNIAKEKAGDNTTLVQGSVDDLPFDDSSFDLITCAGLTGALDKDTATAFYKELARVMTSDGVYIEGSYMPDSNGSMGEEMTRIVATSKAMLSDMIVDTVSGKLSLQNQLEFEDQEALLTNLGLRAERYDIIGDDKSTHNLITVISKTPASQ